MTIEERLTALEADNARLRAQLAQALALVQRGGQLIPDWRNALRMIERWVRQDYSAPNGDKGQARQLGR